MTQTPVVQESGTQSKTVDVIIPTYRPGHKFRQLLNRLTHQTYPVDHIIIMNTEESLWNLAISEEYPDLEVHHVTRNTYDHGNTRNQGASYSKADILLFMTDDAVPADEHLVEALVSGFDRTGPEGEQVAVVSARQLADTDCRLAERYTRTFNYPAKSRVKTKADLPELGIKTYFSSNACSAYDRAVFIKQGGFIKKTIFNEDMIYAAGAIKAGYATVYAADAKVVHSHNYTNLQQFHRNFDLAVSQADNPEVFEGIRSEGEGIKLVKKTAAYLVKQGKPWLVVSLVVTSAWKYAGYLMGKRYKKLPVPIVRWCSMNRNYWKNPHQSEDTTRNQRGGKSS